jgi:carbohydrate-selective porin OprB
VGQPPKIVSSDLPLGQNVPGLFRAPFDGRAGDQDGTTTHVEAFYRLRITENITLTPGVIVLFQPGNTRDSDTVTIGALRTTFSF